MLITNVFHEDEMHIVADFVKAETGWDVRRKERTRKASFMMALYLFYVLVSESSDIPQTEIALFVRRDRSSVSLAIKRNSEEAKAYYPTAYSKWNPLKKRSESQKFMFKQTFLMLEKASEYLQEEKKMLLEQQDKVNELFTRMAGNNEKLRQVVIMLQELSDPELEDILVRLPPIITMTKSKHRRGEPPKV